MLHCTITDRVPMDSLLCHELDSPRSAVFSNWHMYKGGFTLIEALLSSLILAVGAVVVCGLSRHCLQNTVRGLEYEQGYRLLDECLDKVLVDGVGKLAHQETIYGDFGSRYERYKYEVKIEPTDAVDLYRVTAFVGWDVAGQEYQLQAMTLMYDL